MNIVMWVLAGGILGWVAFAFLGFNEHRGMMTSIIIGIVGGFFGGKVIAPLFAAAAAVPGALSVTALVVATTLAAAFLAIGDQLYKRWGV